MLFMYSIPCLIAQRSWSDPAVTAFKHYLLYRVESMSEANIPINYIRLDLGSVSCFAKLCGIDCQMAKMEM